MFYKRCLLFLIHILKKTKKKSCNILTLIFIDYELIIPLLIQHKRTHVFTAVCVHVKMCKNKTQYIRYIQREICVILSKGQ